MSIAVYIALGWLALSIISGIAFCWLLKRGFIGFAPIVDRSEFDRGWGPRK